jgi:transcription antitermination factor NusG
MRTVGASETVAISQIPPFDSQWVAVLSADSLELRWYAAYTCANHEKRVREQLEQRSLESFLPVYETVRQWKDRRMQLQVPLFPGYLFVRIAAIDRLRVLQVPGLVRLVGFNGQLAALPDEEIEALKQGLAGGVRAEPHPFLTVGRRVRVKRGPFEGRQGILLRRKGKLRLVLSIELIMRSVVIDIDIDDVEPEDARQSGRVWDELTMRGLE